MILQTNIYHKTNWQQFFFAAQLQWNSCVNKNTVTSKSSNSTALGKRWTFVSTNNNCDIWVLLHDDNYYSIHCSAYFLQIAFTQTVCNGKTWWQPKRPWQWPWHDHRSRKFSGWCWNMIDIFYRSSRRFNRGLKILGSTGFAIKFWYQSNL